MSSISNLPYGKIIDYWYEKLKNHRHRNRFLITKFFETLTFKYFSSTHYPAKKRFFLPKARVQHIPEKPNVCLVIPVYAFVDDFYTFEVS